MGIKAVIFDLDGTITQPYLDFNLIRREMGLPEDGLPILEALDLMSEQERTRALGVLHRHEKEALDVSQLNPGATETLTALRVAGIPVGVLTRNLRGNALAVASKHGLTFDWVVGRDDGPVKPDPFGVIRLCDRFGVEPSATLVVGDYLFDLLCARAAGAKAVLLLVHPRVRRFAEFADYTIECLPELLGIIEGQSRT